MAEAKNALFADRRDGPRARLNLPVRYMPANGSEHFGSVADASSSGLAIIGPARGAVGEKVVAYVNGAGRVEGAIVRHISGGFAIKMETGSRAAAAIERPVEEHGGAKRD